MTATKSTSAVIIFDIFIVLFLLLIVVFYWLHAAAGFNPGGNAEQQSNCASAQKTAGRSSAGVLPRLQRILRNLRAREDLWI